MIFVTVGTHEQQFDRLVQYIDELKGSGAISEEVVIQTGFSTYEPKHCTWQKLFPYPEMVALVAKARIVITHGGPSSFLMPLQIGKIPVVMPRQKQFDEHVNDHQLTFCRQVAQRQKNILLAENTEELGAILANYDALAAQRDAGQTSNNTAFCQALDRMARELVGEKQSVR